MLFVCFVCFLFFFLFFFFALLIIKWKALLLLIQMLLLLSSFCGCFVFGPCFVVQYLVSFLVFCHLAGEERADCFTNSHMLSRYQASKS